MQLQLKYRGKSGFLALKAIFCNKDGTNFICTLRFLIVRSVRTGKGDGSGADLEEFTKLNKKDLMIKMKSMALMRRINIIFTLLNRIAIVFSSAHIFSDSHKVFGFLVTLLYIICKKVILLKFSDFWLQYLLCCS